MASQTLDGCLPCLPRVLSSLGAREIGRVLCTCKDAVSGAGVWQELFLAREYIILERPSDTQVCLPSTLWRDLARSIFTGMEVPKPQGPWSFQSIRELEVLSSKWRGCPAADLAGVALFKELCKQREANYGRDPLSSAFYRGHLRALRHSHPMAAVPLTFRWPSKDDHRSEPCCIGLPRFLGTLKLRLEQWGDFLQLTAEVQGESPSLALLHISVVSIEPFAPFIMSLLGRKRIPSKWLRPLAWILPGFDPLPRWWPALGGGQDGEGESLQMSSLRALLVLRFAVSLCHSSEDSSKQDSSNEPSTTSPSEMAEP